ncbi:hypothetical protein SAMN04489722_101455 [Algibacter lectus]|uniref:beta-agarase n=1 Tax=Algibacter lectus TaxID=221126 RepID=UPI0008E07419|nr:beta-agarase [Algibacter lectus]SFC01314.1 hypothetical protein SAMN04489722_101455 [Algibacter lectus]
MKKYHLFFVIYLIALVGFSQNNTVNIDFTTQKFIGSESELNREKYFAMHGSYTDNGLADNPEYLFDDLGIKFGRTFGGPRPYSKINKNNLSIENAQNLGITNSNRYKKALLYNKYKTEDLIITNHPREAFQYKGDYQKAAAFNAEYIKHAYPVMPKYYEVMNEPFVHAKDFVKTYQETNDVIIEMSKFHKIVAEKVKAKVPNILVGGYSAAWPEYDKNNFAIWNTRMKVFMDLAGENMDFFATHIYDGRNVEGSFNYRSGSNSEAILDLIESYSYQKWGKVKPHLISEYGFTAKGLQGKPYSPELNGVCLMSYNKILMSLLDKPDRLLKAVPFITGKAAWFYKSEENKKGHPYPWVLIRKTKNETYEYTHLKKFWELWKDVNGNRIYTTSNNPDIQVNAFSEKEKAYVAINNLADNEQTINLDYLKQSKALIKNLTIRRSFISENGIPQLLYVKEKNTLSEITLQAGETIILDYDINPTKFTNSVTETNNYSNTCLQPITAKQPITFTIGHVKTSKKGNATIKMGLGRAHNLSKKPTVKINGITVDVPSNWAGYDQAGREQFFGVIPIPTNIKNTKNGNNTVELTFPDTGGFVSSVILNIEN